MSYRCTMPVRLDATFGLSGSQRTLHFQKLSTVLDFEGARRLDNKHEFFKSKLWVQVDDSRLYYEFGEMQKEIFTRLVGCRFNPAQRVIVFTSRHLPSRDANENRVIDLYEESFLEAHRLAHRFKCEDEGFLFLNTSAEDTELSKIPSNKIDYKAPNEKRTTPVYVEGEDLIHGRGIDPSPVAGPCLTDYNPLAPHKNDGKNRKANKRKFRKLRRLARSRMQ